MVIVFITPESSLYIQLSRLTHSTSWAVITTDVISNIVFQLSFFNGVGLSRTLNTWSIKVYPCQNLAMKIVIHKIKTITRGAYHMYCASYFNLTYISHAWSERFVLHNYLIWKGRYYRENGCPFENNSATWFCINLKGFCSVCFWKQTIFNNNICWIGWNNDRRIWSSMWVVVLEGAPI